MRFRIYREEFTRQRKDRNANANDPVGGAEGGVTGWGLAEVV